LSDWVRSAMRRATLELLIDPISTAPLTLEDASVDADGNVEEGVLRASGRRYAVRAGIPRLVAPLDPGQAQTAESFGYKWSRRETYGSEELADVARRWFVERYGFDDPAAMRAHFGQADRILDAGCGSGFSAGLWIDGWDEGPEWIGVDVSTAVDVARERFPAAEFIQADLLRLPFRDGTFEVVFAEGVLHHTPATWDALGSLARVLRPGGEACFYVYRSKAPVREFTDDHVRAVVSGLPPEEAWELLRPLTLLGRALAELNQEIEVPEDIDVLGIPAGRYDVQRLVYWHFAKLFWNKRLAFEENLHVNFDWYHPQYAHRHTEGEVRDACARYGLRIEHFDAQEAGFTVRARKA
jgi:arsenite methyltransferase